MARIRRRWGPALARWAIVVLATACGSPSTGITARSGASSSSTSTITDATGALRVSEADDGESRTVNVGQKVVVTLASTYWTIAAPSDARVLDQDAPPVVVPGGPSCPKIPGTGCGTVMAAFTASAPGQTDLSAVRTSCGEALRCSESQSHWRFHVQVSVPAITTQPVHPTTTSTFFRTTVPGPSSTSTPARLRSGVSGTVLFGPVCPVEHVPPDPQCAPRSGAADIRLVRTDNGTILNGMAGTDGRFSIPAEPGIYVVQAVASAPSPGRGCSAEPSQVTVAAGAVASVSVSCDTGIR